MPYNTPTPDQAQGLADLAETIRAAAFAANALPAVEGNVCCELFHTLDTVVSAWVHARGVAPGPALDGVAARLIQFMLDGLTFPEAVAALL